MNLMLSLTDLKKYYIKLYQELRNYVWDFNTVRHLAELEISVFRRFPLMPEIRTNFNQLHSCISRTIQDDEYLAEAVNNFKSLIDSSDSFYSMIVQPKEV